MSRGTRLSSYEIESIGAELVARSPTFEDLLRRLRGDQHLLLYLRFVQLPLPPPGGRTRFEVAPSELVVGVIELDAVLTHPVSRNGAIVVHELAHASEVSCLPRARTTQELLQKLRARAAAEGRPDSAETRFAMAVERAVFDEWFAA